jgi:hypothetical protein
MTTESVRRLTEFDAALWDILELENKPETNTLIEKATSHVRRVLP